MCVCACATGMKCDFFFYVRIPFNFVHESTTLEIVRIAKITLFWRFYVCVCDVRKWSKIVVKFDAKILKSGSQSNYEDYTHIMLLFSHALQLSIFPNEVRNSMPHLLCKIEFLVSKISKSAHTHTPRSTFFK